MQKSNIIGLSRSSQPNQTAEEATVNAMVSIIQAVQNPQGMLTTAKELLEINTLSEKRKQEKLEAERIIENARIASNNLDRAVKEHQDYVAKTTDELTKRKLEVTNILAISTSYNSLAEQRNKEALKKENDILARENAHLLATEDLQRREVDYKKRSESLHIKQKLFDEKSKRLNEVIKDMSV